MQVPVMVVWRKAPSSLSHDLGFSCVWDVLAGLSTDWLTVGTVRLQVHWLIAGRKPASPPWVGLALLILEARKYKVILDSEQVIDLSFSYNAKDNSTFNVNFKH